MKIVLISINIDDQSSSRFFFYQASRDTIRCFEEIARLYSEKCKAKAQIDWPADKFIARNSYDSAKTRYNETDSQYFKL